VNSVDVQGTMICSADFSTDGRYRYSLTRRWRDGLPVTTFIMLNPSTADAAKDDPTIRKCIGFARRWNAGGINVVNLFAVRSTNPRALYSMRAAEAIGPRNQAAIYEGCLGSGIVCAAWGLHGRLYSRDRAVLALLRHWGILDVRHLGLTKDGSPRHPLMVPYSVSPEALAWP
jgi:hypothetical protein